MQSKYFLSVYRQEAIRLHYKILDHVLMDFWVSLHGDIKFSKALLQANGSGIHQGVNNH